MSFYEEENEDSVETYERVQHILDGHGIDFEEISPRELMGIIESFGSMNLRDLSHSSFLNFCDFCQQLRKESLSHFTYLAHMALTDDSRELLFTYI